MKKVLFVGLGRMGYPMAGHLLNTADVTVTNRSASKVQRWLADYSGSALGADNRFDAIILCVGNDEDVRTNLLTPTHLLQYLQPGGVVVDHTTTSASLSQEMFAQAQQRGVDYLDAPVSGGEAGAIGGTLSCMVGGQEAALEKVRPLLASYCRSIVYIGGSGHGQIAKMANQFCIAGILAGLAEAMTLIEKENLDAQRVFSALAGGAAQSWQMDNRASTMLEGEFNFGFAIDHMIKDLTYGLDQASSQKWQPIVSEQVLNWFHQLSQAGFSRCDTSALIEHYRKE